MHADKKYLYKSGYTWYPRTSYYRYFMAKYDIRSLKAGCDVGVHVKCNRYIKYVISSINWNCSTSRFIVKQMKLQHYGVVHENMYVEEIKERLLLVDTIKII